MLAHDFGAASEVLGKESDQLVDANDPEAVIKKLEKWVAGNRPQVTLNETFRQSTVVSKWLELLA